MTEETPLELEVLRGVRPQRAVLGILTVSALALGGLLFVLYGHGPTDAPGWVRHLPAVNATLNAASASLLVVAYRAIRRGDRRRHARAMLGALGTSTLFLASYLAYHAVKGDTRFTGQGLVRPVYFFVLASHVLLSAVVLPLVLSSFYFALSGRVSAHRKVARWTLPIWLYVSVTGVLVFALLRAFG